MKEHAATVASLRLQVSQMKDYYSKAWKRRSVNENEENHQTMHGKARSESPKGSEYTDGNAVG